MAEIVVRREFDAAPINAILNHPDVLPWVTLPGFETLDATALLADHNNILLMVEGGGLIFHRDEPGLYEIHTNFLPSHRGKYAYDAIVAMLRWMFVRTDCMMLQTRVPAHNKAARLMTERCGGHLVFSRERQWPTSDGPVRVDYFSLPYEEWAKGAPGLIESGKAYHDRLDHEYERHGRPAHDHDDEDCHFRYSGAAYEMILGGQPEKGVGLYNRWARFAGYAQIGLISRNPIVIDNGDALLVMDGPDFRVLKCRPLLP